MQTHPFQTMLRSAYSHGLENIYALENVDPRSIRPFQVEPTVSAKIPKKINHNISFCKTIQLDLDLGSGFRKWITPFFPEEPVDILELNKLEKKILEDHGIIYLKQLMKAHFPTLMSKGIGQGHWQEIQTKLKQYLADKSPDKCSTLDFSSFLRVIFGTISKKKAHLFLMPYDLQDLMPLLPSETMEIKRLSDSKRLEWDQEVMGILKNPKKMEYIRYKIKEITHNFLFPWMEKKLGIALLSEIIEYLENLSMDSFLTEKALVFLSDVYFSGEFPLDDYLYPTVQGIYAADPFYSDMFRQIEFRALSYFYKPSTTYSLDNLTNWLEREFAKEWTGFPCGMVEKVLSLSPLFYLWRNLSGFVEIRLG